jgi:hypothetical protein
MPKKEAPEARLEDLDVREVSLVDKPANRRRFLVVKRQEDSMSTKRRAAPADEVRKDDAGNDATDGKNTDDANTQVAKDEEGSFLDILGIGDSPGEGEGASDDQGDADAGDQGGDTQQVQKAEKAKDVLGKLTPILQKLTGAVTKAKDLGGKPLTPEIAKTISEVVKALQGFGGKADDDGGDGDAGDGEKDKKEKADTGALASAVSKLTAIVEAVKKAGDGDAPKDIATKLASIAKGLEGFLSKQKAPEDKKADDDKDAKDKDKKDAKGKTEKAFEVFKAAGSGNDDDPEVIIKAGAKMKRSRLSKLKKAVETLAALISELEGEASGGKEKATKAEVDLSPVMNRIDEFASAVKSRFEALEGKTDAVNKRVENIENTRPAGNGEGDPDPVQKSDEGENFWAGVL